MKKLYAAILGVLVAGSAIAAPAGRSPQKISKKTSEVKTEFKMNVQPRKTNFKLTDLKAVRSDDVILSPAGDKVIYSYDGLAIYYSFLGLMAGELTGATDVVYDYDNKKAYLHAPIGSMQEGYVEGTISDDGKKITVKYPQIIGYVEDEDEDGNPTFYPLNISVMNQVEVDGFVDFIPALPADNVVEYNINEDGTVAMTPFQDDFYADDEGYVMFPEKYLSCYVTVPKSLVEDLEEGEEDSPYDMWYYDGNITQVFEPLPSDLVIYDIPENLDWTPNWRVIGADGNYALCKVAFKDDMVYIGDLVPESDAVIVGTLQDGKITLKDRQYLGIHEAYDEFIYLLGADAEEAYDEDYDEFYTSYAINGEDMVFTWNVDKKEMVFEGANKGMLLNASLDYISYYDAFVQPVINFQTDEDLCVAPPAPTIYAYEEYEGWDPMLVVNFNDVCENGVVLNYENMSFEVFINGELNVFSAEEYELEEDMTEIPCYFDNYDLAAYGSTAYITIFDGGIDTIGVRTINNAPDGKKYYSDIDTYQVAGLKNVESAQDVKAVRYYDLQGRLVANPAAGSLVIKVMTLGDGSNKVVKSIK